MAQMASAGLGNDMTLHRGLLWIVTRQELAVSRLPGLEESVTLRTWPGVIRHGIFPRHYDVVTAAGETLARGVAVWSLLHADSRTIETRPQDLGVTMEPVAVGTELPRPRTIRARETEKTAAFTVPYSAVDLNGHMNNARYLDLAEDLLTPAARAAAPGRLRMEYHNEALLGEALSLRWTEDDAGWYMEGVRGEDLCFRLEAEAGKPAAADASGTRRGT